MYSVAVSHVRYTLWSVWFAADGAAFLITVRFDWLN
jgi:hypothetical protein